MKIFINILICLVGMGCNNVLADDPFAFGRLFIEPSIRNQMDESRKQYSSQQLNLLDMEEIEEENAPTAVRMDGMIMRRDGSTEVWINGVNPARNNYQETRQTPNHAGGDRFQITVPGGAQVTLKPGQVYSLESRRVVEGYEADKELEPEQPQIEETPPPAASEESVTAAGKTAAVEDKPP
ncbi:MAG TPA: hypothetical protein VGL10_07740, partial [Gammaproteobacteria bacterium]